MPPIAKNSSDVVPAADVMEPVGVRRVTSANRRPLLLLPTAVLPNAPLDYSATAEALLLEGGVDYLDLVYDSPRWRIWELRDPVPPASGGATLLAAGPNWFMVNASKPTVVKYRYTPYWSTTNACVSRAPGGWTRVEPEEPGVLMVQGAGRSLPGR